MISALVVSLRIRLLYSYGNRSRYPSDRKFGKPQNRSQRGRDEEISASCCYLLGPHKFTGYRHWIL